MGRKVFVLWGIIASFFISFLFISCELNASSSSDDDNDSGNNNSIQIDVFGSDLRDSLPELAESSGSRDAYSALVETYSQAQSFGGLFQRVLGQDPVSVYFCIDMVDDIIEIISDEDEAANLTFATTATDLVLPFFGDTVSVTNTFSYNGTYETTFTLEGANSSTVYDVDLTGIQGGYSSTNAVIAFRVKLFESGSTTATIDSSFVFYGSRDDNGKLLLKSVRYESEDGDPSTYNRAQVYFNRDSDSSPFLYKVVSNYNNGSASRGYNVFSIIAAGDIDKFVIRRRSCKDLVNDSQVSEYADQYFVCTYDSTTNTLGSTALAADGSTDSFDVDGDGFESGGTGGLGDQIDLHTSVGMDDFENDIKASSMFDFSSSTAFPSDRDAVTPDWD